MANEADKEEAIQIAILQTKVDAQGVQLQSYGQQLADVKTALDNLTAIMNRGKGAFTASLMLSGIIGAVIMKALSFLHLTGKP